MRYRITSNLSESQIESDVASFLGYVTPFWSARFKLISVNEQTTGADKLFNRFVPIYLQFKVSQGLKPISTIRLPSLGVPLEKIRTFRHRNNLVGDPILYFRLRDKAKTAKDFQHNVLLSLHRPPRQFAFYVAPLTLDIQEYNELMKVPFYERIIFGDPFRYHPSEIYRGTQKQPLGSIPFLRGHVSIPPIEPVTDSNHHYSFSKNGADIVWHRGVKQFGDFRLATQLATIFDLAYNNDELAMTKQEYLETVSAFQESSGEFTVGDDFDIERKIIAFGSFLYQSYGIRLFLLGVDERYSN